MANANVHRNGHAHCLFGDGGGIVEFRAEYCTECIIRAKDAGRFFLGERQATLIPLACGGIEMGIVGSGAPGQRGA